MCVYPPVLVDGRKWKAFRASHHATQSQKRRQTQKQRAERLKANQNKTAFV